MEIAVLILLVAVLALIILLLVRKPAAPDTRELRDSVTRELQEQLTSTRTELNASLQAQSESQHRSVIELGQLLQNSQNTAAVQQRQQLSALEQRLLDRNAELERKLTEANEQLRISLNAQNATIQANLNTQQKSFREQTANELRTMETRMHTMEEKMEARLEAIRSAQAEGMLQLREENSRKLDEIRGTVDEKLQSTLEKRISESFKTVSDQLEQVYKGLGEMQSLAGDVGGLKKVLSGVKTRGILGEIQLGGILEEILAPEQYDTNVATVPGSANRVEFAVKLPAEGGTVWLPIDSKFPGDRYTALLEAQESGDRLAADAAYKALETVIRSEAKDIHDKYISVPDTTNFGIMFLPFEGLYAEVVNHGLVEQLQRSYQVNVAGPSTMAALLNSLQMGFRTLAIQKRSNEAWKTLSAVKTEFEKFYGVMEKMQAHLEQTSKDLELLSGTRARAMMKKLNSVQSIEAEEASRLLELGEDK